MWGGGMSEINPDNPLVQALHDSWHLIVGLMIHKFKQAEVVITAEDIESFDAHYGGDTAVLCHDKKDGLHLMIVTRAQGEALAAQEGTRRIK